MSMPLTNGRAAVVLALGDADHNLAHSRAFPADAASANQVAALAQENEVSHLRMTAYAVKSTKHDETRAPIRTANLVVAAAAAERAPAAALVVAMEWTALTTNPAGT